MCMLQQQSGLISNDCCCPQALRVCSTLSVLCRGPRGMSSNEFWFYFASDESTPSPRPVLALLGASVTCQFVTCDGARVFGATGHQSPLSGPELSFKSHIRFSLNSLALWDVFFRRLRAHSSCNACCPCFASLSSRCCSSDASTQHHMLPGLNCSRLLPRFQVSQVPKHVLESP